MHWTAVSSQSGVGKEIHMFIYISKKVILHITYFQHFSLSHVKVTATKQFNFPPSVQFHLKVSFE